MPRLTCRRAAMPELIGRNMIGRGSTAAEAIADLLEIMQDI